MAEYFRHAWGPEATHKLDLVDGELKFVELTPEERNKECGWIWGAQLFTDNHPPFAINPDTKLPEFKNPKE